MTNSAADSYSCVGCSGTPKRHTHRLLRQRIGEGHGPGQLGRHAPAAARGEAAQPSDAVAQRDAGREHVRRLQRRQTLAAHVDRGRDQRRDQAAVEDAAGLQAGQREDLARIAQVVGDVDQEHHDLGAHDGGQRAVDPQVHDRVAVQARAARQARRSSTGPPGTPAPPARRRWMREAADMKELREHQVRAGWRLGCSSSSSSRPLPITMAGVGHVEGGPVQVADVELQKIGDAAPHDAVEQVADRAAQNQRQPDGGPAVQPRRPARACQPPAPAPPPRTRSARAVRQAECESLNRPNATPRFCECTISKKPGITGVHVERGDVRLDDPLGEAVEREHRRRPARRLSGGVSAIAASLSPRPAQAAQMVGNCGVRADIGGVLPAALALGAVGALHLHRSIVRPAAGPAPPAKR